MLLFGSFITAAVHPLCLLLKLHRRSSRISLWTHSVSSVTFYYGICYLFSVHKEFVNYNYRLHYTTIYRPITVSYLDITFDWQLSFNFYNNHTVFAANRIYNVRFGCDFSDTGVSILFISSFQIGSCVSCVVSSLC